MDPDTDEPLSRRTAALWCTGGVFVTIYAVVPLLAAWSGR